MTFQEIYDAVNELHTSVLDDTVEGAAKEAILRALEQALEEIVESAPAIRR